MSAIFHCIIRRIEDDRLRELIRNWIEKINECPIVSKIRVFHSFLKVKKQISKIQHTIEALDRNGSGCQIFWSIHKIMTRENSEIIKTIKSVIKLDSFDEKTILRKAKDIISRLRLAKVKGEGETKVSKKILVKKPVTGLLKAMVSVIEQIISEIFHNINDERERCLLTNLDFLEKTIHIDISPLGNSIYHDLIEREWDDTYNFGSKQEYIRIISNYISTIRLSFKNRSEHDQWFYHTDGWKRPKVAIYRLEALYFLKNIGEDKQRSYSKKLLNLVKKKMENEDSENVDSEIYDRLYAGNILV